MLQIIIYIVLAVNILGSLVTISEIGKPRKPIDTEYAIKTTVVTGLYIWLFVAILNNLI